jgi:hypothetical protein
LQWQQIRMWLPSGYLCPAVIVFSISYSFLHKYWYCSDEPWLNQP